MSIWQYSEIKNSLENINEEDLLTLQEGDTPLEQFEDESNRIFLKREDQNPTGSWKDRGTAYKLTVQSLQFTEKIKSSTDYRPSSEPTSTIHHPSTDLVIASSGNAAISLINYAKLLPQVKVHIVMSPEANPEKIKIIEELIKDTNHEIHFAKNAKQKRAELVANGAKLISSSTDQDFIKGYWSLGFELAKAVRGNLDKENYLIVPVSSGAALVGLVEGLFIKLENEYKIPKIIVCQTESCHPIVDLIQSNNTGAVPEPRLEKHLKSLADAIVDKSVLRSPQITKIIERTDGTALKITNEELEKAKQFAESKKMKDLSWTSLLSIAGYLRLKEENKTGNFFCIASGR